MNVLKYMLSTKSVLIMTKKKNLYDMKVTINGMKGRPSCFRSHTVTSFNENDT